MTDNKRNELFGVAKLSKPYTYTNISINSITPRLRVLSLPIVWSPVDKPLAWAGLASMEEGNGEVHMERIPYGKKYIWRGVRASGLPPLQPPDSFSLQSK